MTCPSLQQLHLKTLFEEVELNSEKQGVKSNCCELERPSGGAQAEPSCVHSPLVPLLTLDLTLVVACLSVHCPLHMSAKWLFIRVFGGR